MFAFPSFPFPLPPLSPNNSYVRLEDFSGSLGFKIEVSAALSQKRSLTKCLLTFCDFLFLGCDLKKSSDTLESNSNLRPIEYPVPHLGKFRRLFQKMDSRFFDELIFGSLEAKIWSNFDFWIHILTVDSSAFGRVRTLTARFLIFGHAEFNETIISQIVSFFCRLQGYLNTNTVS
ncbi:hypothetical protein RCL_jg1115.t1 [Rhizophagus clarus]|uniref:Uncharacterized protein n=1 Tax=Rhizophagus clarus TaxID=94130 RepID=A0A8H3MD26_9GLOM|nr:hypothetical protein RCL_jg1115.t1 [Rhizophagus clarus]